MISQEGLLINAQSLFDSAQVLQEFSISWNLFNHIKQRDVHLDLPQHLKDSFLLKSLLFASQCLGKLGGGGGGCMLAFIKSSLMITCSGSPFSRSLVFFTGLDTGYSISLPLLKVIMAWTSSIFGADLLRKFSSCTPLGLGSVWDGNLPFSCTCCWLFRLLMEVYMVSIFLFRLL